ncbi:MAG: Rieske (2Fe-2S) protein [Reichenbachiella sp.]|uniref:Rieske (2Fe-2S) protein n=1 Tax=Reichenbachiella sp. TaxID=2184521 RepID=UPI0032974348
MDKYLVFESKEQAERVIPLNQIKKIRIGKLEICMANTRKGFLAFEKNCPHLSEDLSKGKINPQGEVVCPWHTFRFDLQTGDECENRCDELLTYHTDWENEQLFVIV